MGKTSVVRGIPGEFPPTPVDFDSPLTTNPNLSDDFSKESKKIWHANLLSRPSSKLDTIQVEATEAGDFTRGTEACPARIVITIFAPFWARIIFSVWARIIFKPMEVLINSRGEEVTFQKTTICSDILRKISNRWVMVSHTWNYVFHPRND